MPSSTSYTDDKPQGVDPRSAASDKVELTGVDAPGPGSEDEPVDPKYWLRCLEDAERAEANWRKRGRTIVGIYRNEHGSGGTGKSRKGASQVTFNILYANTETMLPAIYQKPPQPVVRARFNQPSEPPPPPPMVGMAPAPGAPGPVPAAGPPMPPTGLPPELGPVDTGLGPQPEGIGQPGIPGGVAPPPVDGMAPPMAGLVPPPPPSTPGKPSQKDIETAAAVMEKALEIVVDDEQSDESVKAAIKDLLLPGRGTCRVRWKPQMEQRPVMAGDGTTPLPDPLAARGLGDNGGPPMEEVKVWEEVGDEYVYWEDILIDPVRAAGDTDWIAFRHLFGEDALVQEFKGNPAFDKIVEKGRLSDLLKWTEESAAKDAVGGGGAIKTSDKLGDVIKKAMVWEIWDRVRKRVIWFIRDVGGLTLRVDPDTYSLSGFYPIPRPMLAVTTTDTQIPRAFYELYADLAADLDETSRRISNLTKQIKVRGGYNAASRAIADLLKADDQVMLPVEGVDMLNGGLANHIWLVPIVDFMAALDKLYTAREQIKQAIYEIMGISDIMRGATKASETATAQRIKGSMGMVRLQDQKQQAGNFVRDLLKMKAEIIAQNFDAETLSAMTGEDVTPEVMAILRSDFTRTCSVDIEADSTVTPDLQEEQQSMAMIMQSVQGVMQGAAQMLQTGILPPVAVMQLSLELLKMFLFPIRYSRPVIELIDDFQEKLQMQPPPPPPPPPGAGPPAPNGGPPGGGPTTSPPPGGAKPNGLPPGMPPM